jgi:Uncharacterized protein conserved in bacteria (DUF2188)
MRRATFPDENQRRPREVAHHGSPYGRRKTMPRKPQVAVEPRSSGRWAVQTDGTQRADSLHDRKSDAVARGRELAGHKQTELVIKNESGRIAGKHSYGNDPRRSKG